MDGFADNMDRLGGWICEECAKKNQPGVEVVARRHLDRLFRRAAIRHQNDVIRKSADLDRTPGDALDDASMFLLANDDYIADLKRAIGVERNAGKEISQSVLES